jgi:hypothetical protein
MHHETWLAYGQRDPFPRIQNGRRMSCSAYVPDDDGREILSRYSETYTASLSNLEITIGDHKRLNFIQSKRRSMPSHLLPFIPYIEKSIGGVEISRQNQRQQLNFVSTIRHWLDACASLHGSRCGNVTNAEHGSWSGPLWLIDVVNSCLVSAPRGAVYVALSYVWGEQAASSCTTHSTLDQFRRKNGLREHEDTLPRVINDALELVRSLDIPFLWVDRFCIVQDDGVAKQCQLSAMGNIYANANFTLVAAQNEDATKGLYGEQQKALDSADSTRFSHSTTDAEVLLEQAMHLMRSKWYSRGWTLQEYLLSKRRVVFHNNTVNWECLCAAWHESQDLTRLPDAHHLRIEEPGSCNCAYTPQTGFVFESLPWPNIFRYGRLVSMYNRHDLTFPEDVFDAFAGILTHLSRSFPGGFISGLPQMCFDAALLWQPWTTMMRRESALRPTANAVLPSWSWAGWAGNMNSESWRSAANYLFETDDEVNAGQQCSWKTFNTVKWTYSVDLTSRRKEIRIPPEFTHEQIKPFDGAKLPPGWSAKAATNGSEQTSYYHICDPTYAFRQPIPIRDQHKAHIPPVTARYLHGTTTRGFLTLGSQYRSTASDCPARDLLTESGQWAGVLRLDRSNCTREIMRQEASDARSRIVELIEISEGEVQNQPIEEKSFDEWNRPGCPRFNGFYRFVNVLWVEWEGNVAYRKALGRVEGQIWRDVAQERIDVTLG